MKTTRTDLLHTSCKRLAWIAMGKPNIRTASSDDYRMRRETRAVKRMVCAGLFDRFKSLLPENIWEKAKGRLRKLYELFTKMPQILTDLKDLYKLDKITPSHLEEIATQGKKALKKAFGMIGQFLTTKRDLPSLTDLIKRTAMGAKVFELMETHVKPKADQLEVILKRYLPTLTRVVVGAVFIWIWLNVDELSWKPQDILKGFTGQITLFDLITSLPESGIGLISSGLFGIGYTVMPYILLARVLWLVGNKMLDYHNGEWVPNWKLVDRHIFEQAMP